MEIKIYRKVYRQECPKCKVFDFPIITYDNFKSAYLTCKHCLNPIRKIRDKMKDNFSFKTQFDNNKAKKLF